MVTIKDAIREVITELGRVVTAEEVIQIVNKRYPNKWKESAINAYLYGCSVNNPPAYTHYPSMPKFLFDHGRRRYELYDPEKHGRWTKGRPVEGTQLVEESEAAIEEAEVSFGLERDLEEYLIRDLNQLEEGLTLYTGEGLTGRQFNTDVGKIDILALDKGNNFVVIELKAGLATDRVVGQILGYMRYVRQNLARGKDVRGMIVAADFDERLRYAIAELPRVSLKKYLVRFEFQDIVTNVG